MTFPGRGSSFRALRAERERQLTERAETEAIRSLPLGPNLPLHAFQNASTYVVARDIEALPDGGSWWRPHTAELERRAEAVGLGRCAIAWAVLELAVWAFERNGRGDKGSGLQITADVLAQKLGCSRSWLYEVLARLEDLGLVKRRRRVRRFLYLAKQFGLTFKHPDGVDVPYARWRDGTGKLRTFIELNGVLYATPKGAAYVKSRERSRRGQLEQGLWGTLWATLKDSARRVTARLRLALAPPQHRTPYGVTSQEERTFKVLMTNKPPRSDPTGPPREGVAFGDGWKAPAKNGYRPTTDVGCTRALDGSGSGFSPFGVLLRRAMKKRQ